jgi:glutaminase
MREVGAFPADTDIFATLDLYFSACSLLTNTRDMAAIAATLANGGVCPLTDEQVFQPETVKNCLSMMYSCGMYDYSGEFAFTVGIPAKSGVSGAILAVIPNVLGIAVWSPSLDEHGNSVRGVRFLEQLVESFNFHNYDNLVQSKKIDPRRNGQGAEFDSTYQAIFAASTGDINELKRLVARGHDLNSADYDGRTPLHLAAAEGKAEAVRYLLDQGVDENPRDRWNNTPADDARRHRKTDVVALLKSGAKAAANARSRKAAPDRKAA